MEYYDYSGALREGIQEGVGLRRPDADEHAEKKDGCWDLIEVNNIGPLERNSRWAIGQSESQEGRRENQFNWEENSLVKFSHFLGFSTKGLEKEILSFLVKIRKRGKKIHSKGLLENSKFERELKRLECSINYEGDVKKKGPL